MAAKLKGLLKTISNANFMGDFVSEKSTILMISHIRAKRQLF